MEIPKLAMEVKSVAMWAHLGLSWREAPDVVDICHRGSNEIVALTAERDALLEALKQIAYRTGDIAPPEAVAQETMRGLWEIATAAIAKAEGAPK